jgi:putative hydrolase of HD superfamily
MTVEQGTQTNGVVEPSAGQLNAKEVQESSWTVQSGMS